MMIMVLAVGTIAADAQGDNLVRIVNNSGEVVKVCIYNSDKVAWGLPKKCYVMKKKEEVIWNREADRTDIRIKLFKPGIVDKNLDMRTLPGHAKQIFIRADKLLDFSHVESRPAVRYRLKVCNEQYDETIFFVLAFEVNNGRLTEGWWSVKKGECKEFMVTDRLEQNFGVGVQAGTFPTTYYYARTFGSSPVEWKADDGGRMICINETSVFKYIGGVRPDRTYGNRCDRPGDSMVSFRRVRNPQTWQANYYLTF